MKSKLILALMCLIFLSVQAVSGQDSENKYKEVLGRMLTVSGAMKTSEAIIPQITAMVKQTSTSAPEDFWNSFIEKYKAKFHNRIVDFYAPVYQKYLTIDDLNKIIAFYESPVGKKLATATPAMTTESMQLGQQLGMEIATELQKELETIKSE